MFDDSSDEETPVAPPPVEKEEVADGAESEEAAPTPQASASEASSACPSPAKVPSSGASSPPVLAGGPALDLMLNAPVGEFREVYSDLKSLAGADFEAHALSYAEKYNCAKQIAVAVPGSDHKMIICDEGRISSSEYYDPQSGQAVPINHARGEASGNGHAHSGLNSQMRQQIEKAFLDYAGSHYKSFGASVFETSANSFSLRVSANVVNNRNFWSGAWSSHYVVSVNGTQASINGKTWFNVHYYEDGNVQVSNNASLKDSVNADSADSLGDKIAKRIARFESEYHQKVDTSLTDLSKVSLKSLRRQMPVTRELFDFASSAHKLASELQSK